jgi:iron(II)-dependent oxidoreductase
MVFVPGGEFEMGTDRLVFAYDNERRKHVRHVDDFLIDRAPVTNGEFVEFIDAGGYERRDLWSPEGWKWRSKTGATLPRYWRTEGSEYAQRSLSSWQMLDPERPVCHVTWFEADAFARFAGKRLPTEAEWEKAASWEAGSGSKRRYPWGEQEPSAHLSNLDQVMFGTAVAGSYEDGASPCGAVQMIGDVWEWTASGFDPYPGFAPFPYDEYSKEFFGGPYRVLRGGAWATQFGAISNTFRNWDHPNRSQIFAGFRCASDTSGVSL